MPHLCLATGCSAEAPTHLPFCLVHWKLCPRHPRLEVWCKIEPGEDVRTIRRERYHQAVQVAIQAIAEAEGRR
jgi:hypothetical protein